MEKKHIVGESVEMTPVQEIMITRLTLLMTSLRVDE